MSHSTNPVDLVSKEGEPVPPLVPAPVVVDETLERLQVLFRAMNFVVVPSEKDELDVALSDFWV
jgi:hypothetical protein